MKASAKTLSDGSTPPKHVAIIMDGNGRWAKERGLPRIEGHRRGAQSVRTVITTAAESGVSYLTLFGFSSENWKRPSDEVNDLMGLLKLYLKKEIASLHKNNVRFLVIGDRARLDDDIVSLIESAETHTQDNTGLTLLLALSYGGRAELTNAMQQLAHKVAAGDLMPEDIGESDISNNLFTTGIPDPDLLIRTSGENRISNFLLWQLAYTEFVFVDTFWPDFGENDFLNAIGDFMSRDRRFGAIQSQGA